MMRVETLFAGAILAAALGFGAGFHAGGKGAAQASPKAAVRTARQAATGILQAAERNQQVEAAIRRSDHEIDQLQQAALARLQKGRTDEKHILADSDMDEAQAGVGLATASAPPAGPEMAGCAGAGAGDRLDLGTVRLLNRARAAGTVESSAGGPG